MRKLASIRKIDSISPIEGADAIEVATVGGWKIVVKKGEYKSNDLVVYLEIDSWVPHKLAPFLSKGKEPREFNGVKGERLRTVKLRGQVSQGLLLPVSIGIDGFPFIRDNNDNMVIVECDEDVSEYLGIQKWERPLPTQLRGLAKGTFPSFIHKADQERCQNLVEEIFTDWKNIEWEVTMKLDGCLFTAYYNNGSTGVCSRNYEFKDDEENANNAFVSAFNRFGVKTALTEFCEKHRVNLAVQCELMGDRISGNRERISSTQLFLFDIFDIDNYCYLTPQEREDCYEELKDIHGLVAEHVPVLERCITLQHLGIQNIDQLISYADGRSLNNPVREGVVFKSVCGKYSFKSISNKFLLKGGD